MRLIDADERRCRMTCKDCIHSGLCYKENEYDNFPDRCGRFIADKDIRPQGEWIPVSERLPDDMQKVLIWFEYFRYGDFNCMYQTYGFGYVLDGKWSPFINGETGWQDYRVIAWQPLPEPYMRGEEE